MFKQVAHAYAEVAPSGEESVAVRSSAGDEDGVRHSFAGQHSSYLYVHGVDDVARRVRSCWASGYSARALFYRRENGLDLESVSIAVVLQTMVDPHSAGVLFTCDPVTGDAGRFVVSSVWGVGEGIVSGELPADTFHLDAGNGAVLERDVVDKPTELRGESSGECGAVPVPDERRRTPSLDAEELAALHDLGGRLAALGRRPQDVEWAIDERGIWILQTRAVTTATTNATGYPNLWDNSNIVESYGGLTSPLSFTFAKRNYHAVYVQFCEILGVPRSVVADLDDTLRNMLGCVNGRVFYNLYNWYKLVGVLPGMNANRRFMETMMGVSDELAAEVEERVLPHPTWTGWRGRWLRARVGLRFAIHHFRIQGVVDRFLVSFRKGWEHYRALDYGRMSGDEIWRKYLELDRVMIRQWKAPIINDFLCMVHFGLLRRLTEKWLGDTGGNLQNDLLAGDGNLESAEPTKELVRLAAEAGRTPGLRELLERTPAAELMESLRQSEFAEFHDEIVGYVDRFGFRCMNEMKLEETDLYSDPSYLFTCLKNYLRGGTPDATGAAERERELRLRAEQAARGRLRGWRRAVYFWSLKHARRAVRNRENTRFCRTRIYGVVRAMFRAMGEDLRERGVLEDAGDVFFLTLEELGGLHEGTLPSPSVADFVAIRRRDYARFETEEPRARFLTRGLVYRGNDFLEREEDVLPDGDWDLKGIACCPGVIEGVVKVVRSASDDLRLDGEILVTPRTDPGWVPLYPSVAGLLVERGSLLSHSAIVAREMGLPAIVGVSGLCRRLQSGMRVRMDGQAGTIEVLG
jgi:pyruvate,water dikinase